MQVSCMLCCFHYVGMHGMMMGRLSATVKSAVLSRHS